jgi:eukaryotic-like serine/threonine-protein kinase
MDIPGAQVLESSHYASLSPGFWVIYYQGPFGDGTQALAYCAAHGRFTANQCIGRFLSHDPADHGYQCYPPSASPSGSCFHNRG